MAWVADLRHHFVVRLDDIPTLSIKKRSGPGSRRQLYSSVHGRIADHILLGHPSVYHVRLVERWTLLIDLLRKAEVELGSK